MQPSPQVEEQAASVHSPLEASSEDELFAEVSFGANERPTNTDQSGSVSADGFMVYQENMTGFDASASLNSSRQGDAIMAASDSDLDLTDKVLGRSKRFVGFATAAELSSGLVDILA